MDNKPISLKRKTPVVQRLLKRWKFDVLPLDQARVRFVAEYREIITESGKLPMPKKFGHGQDWTVARALNERMPTVNGYEQITQADITNFRNRYARYVNFTQNRKKRLDEESSFEPVPPIIERYRRDPNEMIELSIPFSELTKHIDKEMGKLEKKQDDLQLRMHAQKLAADVYVGVYAATLDAAIKSLPNSAPSPREIREIAYAAAENFGVLITPTPFVMPGTWQDRLRAEREELMGRIDRLGGAVDSPASLAIPAEDLPILQHQLRAMRLYCSILDERVARLDGSHE